MSRTSKRSTSDHEQIKRQRKKTTTTKTESPCGRRPAAINATDITLTFLENDAQRHAKYRLRVTWPEVTDDIDGFPVSTIDRYIVHLQHSDDGVTWDNDFRRKVVDAKDGDTDTTAKAIFKGITRKRYYRVRVRARDEGGCKSDLSSWTAAQRAGGADTVPSVGTISRTRVGPRRIEFDWDDIDHPDLDRYRVVILKADTETGTFSQHGTTKYVRNSRIAIAVDDADKTRWWKVRVRAQLIKNPDGTRDESGSDTDSTADQANDLASGSGAATVAPSTPTNLSTRSRPKAVLVRWQDGNSANGNEPTDSQMPIRYIVHASKTSGFTPSSLTRVGVVDGEKYLVTQWNNNGTLTNFTKQDANRTFYFKVVARNSVGSATSAQVSGSPSAVLEANAGAGEDDADIVTIRANRFVADDGVGDRIQIADTSASKAQLKFFGGSGNSCIFAVGNAGNVTVTGGKVTFQDGIEVPYTASPPTTANGAIFVANNGLSENGISMPQYYLYWRANGRWKRAGTIAST